MKKLLSLLLVCLLLPLSGLAEAAVEAPAPRVGDVVEGFELIQVRDFPLIGGEALLFEHEATGALLLWLKNADTNRVFDLTFLTQATDNTGLPHVFEHSTLDGSEKYPSKALFFNLTAQTYNSYMNASTYPTMTTYPVASLSEAQLLKYADFYTDSCLNPMIMEDESIYREEAWRYRLSDRDAELTLEGTVYSEMLGAYTLAHASSFNLYRAAFPGSRIGNISGGDPKYIPDMTYEALREYHDHYYHPSNAMALLYGSFEDYTAFLRLLNEAFAPYERRTVELSDPDYEPLTGPAEHRFAFPAEAGGDTEHASEVYYAFVCPGLKEDPDAEQALDHLTSLLGLDSSDLMQSLEKALPYGSFDCYLDDMGPEDLVVFGAENVDDGDAERFRSTVDEALSRTAEAGFPQEMVDGAMASLSLSTALVMENSQVGVNLAASVALSYADSGNPFAYQDSVEAMDNIDAWNAEGRYTQAISDWLLGNELNVLVTTYPEPGAREAEDAALKEKLAQVKAGMSDEELEAIIQSSNAPQEEDDASEYVRQLQAVTVESLPEEYREYALTDETGEDGVRRLTAEAAVDGIGRADVWLDAAGIPQEDLHWMHLYTDLLGEMDTEQYDRGELAQKMERWFYSTNLRLSLTGREDDYHPWLRLGWIAREEDLAEGYDLMYEILFHTKLDDPERLQEEVSALKADAKSGFKSAPYSIALDRGMSLAGERTAFSVYYNDLDYYAFLDEAARLLNEDPQAAVEKLQAVQKTFHNRAGAMTAYAGTPEGMVLNRELSDAFLAKLDDVPVTPVTYDFPKPAMREGIIIEGGAQYNGYVADLPALGLEEYNAELDAVTSWVYDAFLIPQLRDQYGAYGVLHAAYDEGMYLLSYRDPNVEETYAVYAGLPEAIRNTPIDQETLDGYILSSYAGYAMPEGELTGALSAINLRLTDREPDEALTHMRQLKGLKAEDVPAFADLYENLITKGYMATVGGASAVNDHAERFDAVLNPLGTQDPADVAFADLPEDSNEYEAVRAMFEQGLMLPKAEDAFGVEDPATAGDLAGALYALLGGDPEDPAAAIAALQEYGLFPADAAAEQTLTDADAEALLSGFFEAVGAEYQPQSEATGEEMTRGRLAGLLFAAMELLEEAE